MDQQGSQQNGGIGKASGTPQRTQEVSLLLPAWRQELTHQNPVVQFVSTCIGVHPKTIERHNPTTKP